MVNKTLQKILNKLILRIPLLKNEVMLLINLKDHNDRELLYKTARELRELYFKNKVFLYGFVYFSTHCSNDCSFCFYRQSNSVCERYRKTTSEIIDISNSLAKSGVNLIDLTMGEDPYYLLNGNEGYGKLIEIIKNVKKSTGLPIMISPGVVPKNILLEMKKAGANWYACYQETHNKSLFKKLRINQSYEERWDIKVYAKTIGMLVEEGLLLGIGDKIEDAADSMYRMLELDADQVRTMSFVPQIGTPLYKTVTIDAFQELNMIAVMRLLFPDKLIPASLDVEGIIGIKERLNAGANVVTSIIPPKRGLMGVSHSTLDIDEGNRTVEGISNILDECGLVPATVDEYLDWVNKMQSKDIKIEKMRWF